MAGMDGIQGFDHDENFYEDDEPVEDVIAAFDAGEKFITAPPAVTLDTHGLTVPATSVGVHAAVRLETADFSAVRPLPVVRSAA